MPREIVWTRGAEADLQQLYESIGDHDLALRALRQPLEHVLSLLADHPALGAKVRGTKQVRRVLAGPRLRYGLFYVEEGRRVMIHVLVDLRQDPRTLSGRLAGL